jgi:cytochrome c-type biogenesis protein CcmH
MKRAAAVLILSLIATTQVLAAGPELPLADPALEARAQNLSREIRCIVCENEPVALSSAEIAIDMRKAIRDRIAAGDTDAQVRRFFAARYGEFVLLRPKVGPETYILWGAPLFLLFLGGLGLYLGSRGKSAILASEDKAEDEAARAILQALDSEKRSH